MTDLQPMTAVVRQMRDAATQLWQSLDPGQRARAAGGITDPDFPLWTYLPGDRPGLALADLTEAQRSAALALLDSGCSAAGARTARGVIELDMISRQLSGRQIDPGDHRYWLRVFGEVSATQPWAWRVNGHHLAVHVTVVGDTIAATPSFFGADPAVVPAGPHQGLRTLPTEEESARSLLAALNPDQLAVAVTAPRAPDDILTRYDPVADPALVPPGLGYEAMSNDQQEALKQLIGVYFHRAPDAYAAQCWSDAAKAGLNAVQFSWAGPLERGQGHYYSIGGPTFLIEYDNTQDNANHIHSVWRDLRRDWGQDLLAAHYAEQHRG